MTRSQQPLPELASVRRLEVAGFRAWPAQRVHYDGTWVVRLTEQLPAKRLNSVNPLDPLDIGRLDELIAALAGRFAAAARPLVFRISPLSGRALSAHLDAKGWSRQAESLVMRLPLSEAAVEEAMDQIPLKDIARFAGAALSVHGYEESRRAGLAQVIGSIEPEAGLFVLEDAELPVATAICVHDGDLAGLFEVASAAAERGKGFGRRIVLSALKWARLRGASEAWLQVEAANTAAVRLYTALGFREVYRYHYRMPPEAS